MASWWTAARAEGWGEVALTVGTRIAIALVALYIGFRMAKWAAGIAARAMGRAQIEPTAVQFLRKVLYVILLVVLVLGVLQTVFGVAPTSLMAVVGAAGLAIGLALKDSLSNVASGVMLVSLKPFRVGDIVTIGGETGKVESVSIFQTRLRGADNQTIVLPNSLITADSIINLTPDTMRRIELIVGISYSASIDVARTTALKVMQDDARILSDPPADVLVYALADNSVNLGIRCHVSNADFFITKCELTERIKKAFDEAGIGIPFPQRDVHMYHHIATEGHGVETLMPGLISASTGRETLGSSQHRPNADPE